jgi:hypothetical protein
MQFPTPPRGALLPLLLLTLLRPAAAAGPASLTNATVSLTFNETLKGFSAPGGSVNDTLADFQRAYQRGLDAGDELSFALHVDIGDVKAWRADPLHDAICTGNVVEAALTNGSSVPVGPAPGALHVFDGGVHKDTHELRMEYILPFESTSSKSGGKHNYTLFGVKHLPGNDCLGLLTQATTLYVHVLDSPGAVTPSAPILRSGIVKIGAGDIISLITSMRLHGGTLVDRIDAFLSFGLLLLGDIAKNCLSPGAYATEFWYFWSSDGSTGVLLDMIKRPLALELRLAQYHNNATTGGPPNATTTTTNVTRQFLPLVEFSLDPRDNVTVRMGKDLVMGPTGVKGSVNGIPIDVAFGFSGRTNSFLPPALAIFDGILPHPVSQYGNVQPQARHAADADESITASIVGDRTLGVNVPLVKTTYKIPYGLEMLQWSMISASQFVAVTNNGDEEDSDLLIEMIGMPLLSLRPILPALGWVAPSYVFVDGNEYKLDGLGAATEFIKVTHDGSLSPDNTERIFGVEIQLPATGAEGGAQHVSVLCRAPAESFVFLEQEGKTYIHTTVMGSCEANVDRLDANTGKMTTKSYQSEQRCLLEIKA